MPTQNDAETENHLRLTDDIELTSNTASDDRWKISFGLINARPHEYLIHIRRGKLVKRTSGQAGRCFKFPSDTVILVPTSLKQLIFQASQLTLDNILIRLRGFAIYRISHPEQIFERISFWDRQSGEKKLALMIGEQCRSHSKWLVANMSLEDCLRKRKQAIADVLLNELRLVITEENFGVSIETIDIQDIKIVQDDLFTAYQHPARDLIFKQQQLSQLEREREVQTRKLLQEQEMAEKAKETRLKVLANAMQIQQAEQEKKEQELQAERQVERAQAEHTRALAEFEAEQQRLRRQQDAAAEREIALAEQQLQKQQAELELHILRERYSIDNTLSSLALEKLFLEKALPEIAQAVTSALRDARVTIYQGPDGGSGLPFTMVVNEILGVLQRRVDRLGATNMEEQEDS